jgi:hypothetical protein
VRVEAPASNHVASRWGERHFTAPGEEGRCKKNGRANSRAHLGIERRGAHVARMNPQRVRGGPLGLRPDGANQLDERLDVAYFRNILESDGFARE